MTKGKSRDCFGRRGDLAMTAKEDFVFLETNKPDKENQRSYFFERPVANIVCWDLADVEKCFQKIEQWLKRGFWVAGFVSYEAGYAFEKKFRDFSTRGWPLLWFGVFKRPAAKMPGWRPADYRLAGQKLNISQKEYLKNISRIKKLLAAGDTYQVNYTLKKKFDFSGSVKALYQNLKNQQKVAYSALIKFGHYWILSFSPELFFRLEERKITARPMKGTAPRGKNIFEDEILAKNLAASAKNRAENLMIVDMWRNDLGKISQPASVKVKKLFEIEKYQTLFQMTSTIEAKLLKNISFGQIFKALFPSASVTGAPKIRTMEIIRDLEKEPRRIYCGAIGFISPEKKAVFNVAIRTLLLDGSRGRGEIGLGGGIVFDSRPEEEWAECLTKGKFLNQKWPADFKLIETMLCEAGTIKLPKYHLSRLKNSAEYFDFCFDEKIILKKLTGTIEKLGRAGSWRVRLLLSSDGRVDLFTEKIEKIKEPVKIIFSKLKTNPEDIFLYHKTTQRQLYERELAKARQAGYFDVIFTNQKGEVTEGAISNIFFKKGRQLFTPPVASGLLNGVFRQYFMKKNLVIEKVLYPEDLRQADEIFLTNAVKGRIRVKAKF